MKSMLKAAGAALVLAALPMVSIAQSAGCHTRCANYCSQQYNPENPSFHICYDGCAAGCTIGPTGPEMPTVPG